MEYAVAFIEGDGIGPEQASATKVVLAKLEEAQGLSLNLVPVEAGDRALKEHGEVLSKESFDVIRKSDCCLKGPVGQSAFDVIIRLRRDLDLYANIRPAKSLPKVTCIGPPETDLVIVRENTEDLYCGLESADGEKATATRVITRKACRRIAMYAFELARTRRKAVTAIHKSNVLKKTDGLFLLACKEVSESYPDVQYSDMLVDAGRHESDQKSPSFRRHRNNKHVRRYSLRRSRADSGRIRTCTFRKHRRSLCPIRTRSRFCTRHCWQKHCEPHFTNPLRCHDVGMAWSREEGLRKHLKLHGKFTRLWNTL